MKNAKIVLVAEWDGWCGACAVERPLVLTRSGRLGLRTWLTVPVDDGLPLTLTCRLCGSSTHVPSEADDPPVFVEPDDIDVELDVPSLEQALTTEAMSLDAAPALGVPAVAAPALAVPALAAPALAAPALAAPALAVPALAAPLLATAEPTPAQAAPDAELARARGALGAALAALVTERTALAERVTLTPSVLPHVPAVAPPALPLQRTASADDDGLATLQLLADGLDLLSSTRS